MIHINIIQVGRTKDKYFADAENEYIKRLSKYAKVEIETVQESKAGDDIKKAVRQEGQSILSRLPKDSFVIVLDIKGKQYDSNEFAENLEKFSQNGKITFIIGGPYGLSEEVLAKADKSLSLSKMTFTHQMVRTILLEQIYRAFTIIFGKKYHY